MDRSRRRMGDGQELEEAIEEEGGDREDVPDGEQAEAQEGEENEREIQEDDDGEKEVEKMESSKGMVRMERLAWKGRWSW